MGEREITARSDVYALGCVTYEMLTGDPAVHRQHGAGDHREGDDEPAGAPPPASGERRPTQVEDAVLTALEKLPADRFATPAEFAAALNGARRRRRRCDPSRPDPARVAHPASPSSPERWRSWAWEFLAGRLGHGDAATPASVTFLQRTFRSEAIYNARFAPDGQTIVYSSAAETSAPELFLIRPDYPEPTAARPHRDPPARRFVEGRAGRPAPRGIRPPSPLRGDPGARPARRRRASRSARQRAGGRLVAGWHPSWPSSTT